MIYDEQVKLNPEIGNPPEFHKISSGILKNELEFRQNFR